MFDLGTQELIVIFIVAFLVFGPKKLPELGRTLGRGIRELKTALRGVKDTFEEAGTDIADEIQDAKDGLEKSLYNSVESEFTEHKDEKEKQGEKQTGQDLNKTTEEEFKEGKETDRDG